MRINDILRDILVTRHFLVEGAAPTDMSRNAYYNAYLLTNFGIAVDEPKKLRKEEPILSLCRHRSPRGQSRSYGR